MIYMSTNYTPPEAQNFKKLSTTEPRMKFTGAYKKVCISKYFRQSKFLMTSYLYMISYPGKGHFICLFNKTGLNDP